MNHLRCACGATFDHIAAMLDHRLTDAPHVKVRAVKQPKPEPVPPMPTEAFYAPCKRCSTTRGNSLPGYGRGYRSGDGLCARCLERLGRGNAA
jgi:hypothetical protein